MIIVEKTITILEFTYPKCFMNLMKARQYIRLLNMNGYEFDGIKTNTPDVGYTIRMIKRP